VYLLELWVHFTTSLLVGLLSQLLYPPFTTYDSHIPYAFPDRMFLLRFNNLRQTNNDDDYFLDGRMSGANHETHISET